MAQTILGIDPRGHKDASEKNSKSLSVKEKNALFATFLLQQKTTLFSEDTIQEVMDALEGKKKKDTIVSLLNQIKTSDMHWFIVPYEKKIEGVTVRGSIRVLIDLIKKKVVKTEVYVFMEEQEWLFLIENNLCEVLIYKQNPFNFDTLIVYLKELLAPFGIDVIQRRDVANFSMWKQVDVAL